MHAPPELLPPLLDELELELEDDEPEELLPEEPELEPAGVLAAPESGAFAPASAPGPWDAGLLAGSVASGVAGSVG